MSMMSTPTTYESKEDEIDLLALLREFWSYKWLLLLTSLVGLTLGIFYGFKQPIKYQANVLLQIENKSPAMGALSQHALLSGGGSSDSTNTQIALLQSRFILEPVIEALGLNISVSQRPTSKWERFSPWSHKQKLAVSVFDVPKADINKSFKLLIDKPDHISLYDENKMLILSGPIGKTLVSKDENFRLETEKDALLPPEGTQFSLVKRSTNSAVKRLKSVLEVEDMGDQKSLKGGTGVLELSLKGTDKEELMHVLDAIAETARTKDAQKKAKEAYQTLNFLDEQLPITKQQLEEAEQKLNKYRATSGKIDIKIQSGFLLNQLAELDKQLSALQVKKIEMKQQYKSTHPAWVALEAQVQALKTQRVELEKELKQLPASDQVAVNLMREVDVKQGLYMVLLNKIQELQVVKAGTVSDVRVLSYATLPDMPLPNKKSLMTWGGMLFGLMIGVMIILTRKFFSQHVTDPHWSERHLNLPNVAIVPYCKEQNEQGLISSLKTISLLADTHPKNLAIEALRSLRTSLQITLACANNNIIGILGVAPSVGKTFVASNLAYLLAAAGKRVLVIDTDLRKGTLHKYFALKASPGLAEFLGDELLIDDVLKASPYENLTVLTRGAYPKNPAELLTSERFKALIETCAKQYDVVLFDTAPVLLVTDAVLVSSLAATNFLVCGAGAHQPSDVELVMKRLHNANVHVNGSIFNFHKEQTNKYYYGKYYNYSYYYHDEAEKAAV